MNSMKRQKDRTLKDELSRLVGAQYAAAAAKSLQSCLTLCDPIDGSPPGSPVPGNLQARTLEWVAISFSSGPHSVRPLHHDPSILGGPTWHGSVSLS